MPLCIICGKREFKNLFVSTDPDLHKQFLIQECGHCGLVRTLIREDIDLSSYYKKTYFAKEKSFFNLIKYIFSKQFKVKPIEKMQNGGSLLDIGCGDGNNLKLFLGNKWRLFGIEPYGTTPYLYPKIKIYKRSFGKTGFKSGFFDVITFWHVFEHLSNPNEVLRESRRILKKEGFLFISLPNSKSLGFKLFKGNWFALYPPVHIYHYNQETISKLLEKNGFNVFKIKRFSPEYTPFVLLQSLENSLGALPRNCLYKGLRGYKENRLGYLVSLAIIPLLILPLLVLIAFEFIAPHGSSVIEVYARSE